MYNKLPTDLKENALFCLWRYEQRNSRQTKVPYRTNGNRGDSTNRNAFDTFGTVCTQISRYNGIGMGIFDDYFAIDIDDCIVDGVISEMALDVISMMDSYTEISPSGKGIRIIGKAHGLTYDKSRYYINNRQIGMEVYVAGYTSKFVTLTGNAIHEVGVEDRGEELVAVLEKYMVKTTPSQVQNAVTPPGSFLTDEEIITKALSSRQGKKFKSFWDGEIPAGKTQSEADQALATILAFWCGGDTEQMDRLFRQSGLMRDKWERDDYRIATLEKAVRMSSSFYTPPTTAADDFSPMLATLQDLDLANNRRYRGGDIGFGRLYADVYKDIARYVPERKKWYIYDGSRWVADIGGLMAMELAKELSDGILQYTATIKDESLRAAFLDSCKKWTQRRFRETYLKEAQSVYPVSMEKFDADRYLFNCRNGTLDLRTMEFREHRSEDFLTKIAGAEYDLSASSPRFATFIDEITSHDTDKARFLQKALGYGISGDTRYECLFFLYGELTRNGKGTLMESCLNVLGDYGRAVRPETIAQKNNVNSQSPSEDLARLAGIRFANISEPSRGLVLNAAQVKSMTGNDTMNARFLNENSFDFKPQFKLYINTNYLPVISDMTLFSSGRVMIIPFTRHFEEWEQDKTLKEEFSHPQTQSAILNWLVEGYRMLRTEGMNPPTAVVEATNVYSHESDKMAQFAEDRLREEPGGEVRTSAVYDAYRAWCYENGCYTENSRNFNHELRKFGRVERRRPRHGGEKTTLLIGYKLKEDSEPFLA